MPFRVLLWTTLFSIAMALMESAVVVYLRALFYESGFTFPLVPMEAHLATVEVLREAATIFMLVGIGVLAGRSAAQRFAWFIYCFAIWDIFYYVWLWVFLNWPAGLLDWDILFLIPFPWIGPVITPLIVTLVMISLAFLMLRADAQGKKAMLSGREWGIFTLGSLVVILSWVWDYGKAVLNEHGWERILTLSGEGEVFTQTPEYLPEQFAWGIFVVGIGVYLVGLGHYTWRNNRAIMRS
ncbi:MAG: hypothetical protein AAGB22_04930 [Bacteroidota bacterium]